MLNSVVLLFAFAGLSANAWHVVNEFGEKRIESYIVGGVNANPGEFPHQIQIRYRGSHMCGGSVLTPNWILTAAHCFEGETPSDLQVVAGEHNWKTPEGNEQFVNVTQFVSHPNRGKTRFGFDVGLIKLASPLTFNQHVKPAVLWKKSDAPSEPLGSGVVSGWGRVSASGRIPDILQKVNVTVYERDVCQKAYGNSFEKSNMLCAGNLDGGKCVCMGDSGGPLMTTAGKELKQVGIVSWGRPCANKGYPAVYVNVVQFEDFIKEKVPEYYEQFE